MLLINLFEGREETIAQNQGKNILAAFQRDVGSKPTPLIKMAQNTNTVNQVPLAIVKYIAQAGLKEVQWLTNMYIKGQFNLEDVNRIKQELVRYNMLKPKLPAAQRNLNSFKSLTDLYAITDAHKKGETGRLFKKEEWQQYFDEGEAKIFFNDPQLLIVIPKTQEASCAIGGNTKWCTAARENNYFEHYTRQGPLYIIFPKNEKRKFQFWIVEEEPSEDDYAEYDEDDYAEHDEDELADGYTEKGEYILMDEQDQEVSLAEFVKKYPSMKKAFGKLAQKWDIFALVDDVSKLKISAFLDNPELLVTVPKEKQTKKMVDNTIAGIQGRFRFPTSRQKVLDSGVLENINPKLVDEDHIERLIDTVHDFEFGKEVTNFFKQPKIVKLIYSFKDKNYKTYAKGRAILDSIKRIERNKH